MASSQNINEEADHNRDWERWKEKFEGIKFRPTAEDLAGHYLAGKVSGSTDGPIFPLIQEVDVYQYEPSKLESKAYDFGDGNMYFFSRIHKKYKKGSIHERKAIGGFWKPGKLIPVIGNRGDRKIATVRSLTYHRNDPESCKKPIKTHWLMKEYMLLKGPKKDKESTTLCVVYFHDKERRQCESENEALSNSENNNPLNMTDIINGSWNSIATALNNNVPAFTPELPSSNSFQDMQNMMGGSSGAPADSNIYTHPTYCSSPFTARDLENWAQRQEANGSLDYWYSPVTIYSCQTQTYLESPSSNVVPSLPNTAITQIMNQNQDPSCLNSAESTLWYPAPNVPSFKN